MKVPNTKNSYKFATWKVVGKIWIRSMFWQFEYLIIYHIAFQKQ
jgi:hypothetical protein